MALSLVNEPVPLSIHTDGVIRVGKTRVTLDTVVAAFREGCSAEEITEQYPTLELAEVYSVIAYYLRHEAEVNQYLADRDKHAAQVRVEAEKKFSPLGLREKLLSRRRRESRP